jgi:diaminopimelate decarboxylase
MNTAQLRPIISDNIRDFLGSSQSDIFKSLKKYHSPLHIIFPDELSANVALYREIYIKNSLEANIYYALKANKSQSILSCVFHQKMGVEVASKDELLEAVKTGFKGTSILASGPGKNSEYLNACCSNNVLVAVDDEQELALLYKITSGKAKKIDVLLRINTPSSRFGMTLSNISNIFSGHHYDANISFRGVSFHINNYSIEERIQHLCTTFDMITFARGKGFIGCDMISIGGGFTINYLSNESWNQWQNNYRKKQVKLYNNIYFSSYYPYYNDYPKQEFLNTILMSKPWSTSKQTVADVFKKQGIRLLIEPGRSMLDQCGMTIFSITGVKYNVSDLPIIMVDGNINAQSEQWFGSDFLVDPLLLKNKTGSKKLLPGEYYIGGNLCLESDMLARRAVLLDQRPEPGDLLVYINTAGYQMDSNESSFSHLPPPPLS